MSMTMSEKILAAHAGLSEVKSGEIITARLDLILGNDVTTPVAVKEFEKCSASRICDPSKIALVMDHFVPNKDIKSAEQVKTVRKFSQKYGIQNFFDVGEMGVEHALLPEKGLVVAGDLVIGADSHTCTYGALGAFSTGVGSTDMAYGMIHGEAWFRVPTAIKVELVGELTGYASGKDVILTLIGITGVDGALYKSLEFTGDGVKSLSMDDRFTICNMAIEAGAKNGIFPVDEKTLSYIANHSSKKPVVFEADADALYERVIRIDLSKIRPTVAFPHLPSNVKTFDEIGSVTIDQVVIGSCTNGRLSDFITAANILRGKKVKKGLRVIVIPSTQKIYLDMLETGLIKDFLAAGCAVSTPTCGPCLGGHMGILAKGERCVATTNRNFVGRMGHPESEVYLVSPATAAASAITGHLTNPENEV